MLFKIFQLAVLAFGIWVIVVETPSLTPSTVQANANFSDSTGSRENRMRNLKEVYKWPLKGIKHLLTE